MKKVSSIVVALLTILILSFYDSKYTVYANDQYNSVDPLVNMSNEHIREILKLAYSVDESGNYNTRSQHKVSEADKFKKYYVSAITKRTNSYSAYFKSNTGWLQRGNGITLSSHYNPSVMFINNGSPNARAANFSIAFNFLKGRHNSSPNWKNTTSMEAQFLCHAFTVGRAKNPWNIAPWRTDSNLASVTAHGCNP